MRYWILGLFALSLSLFLCAQEKPAPPAAQQQPEAPAAPQAPAAKTPTPHGVEAIDKGLQANVYIGAILKIDLEKNLMDLTVTAEDGTSEIKHLQLDPKVRLFNRGSGLGLKDLKAGTRVRVLYNPAKEGELPVAKRIVVKPPDASNTQAKPRGTGN